jgi:oligopeptide/dipeptide ABC transporter ATP-binding protein
VTHDLAVAAAVADRIAVMYAGRIVEEREGPAFMAAPAHPYSMALRQAALPFAPHTGSRSGRLPELPGRMPAAGGQGCAFASRCPLVFERCLVDDPPRRSVNAGWAACWLAGERSP